MFFFFINCAPQGQTVSYGGKIAIVFEQFACAGHIQDVEKNTLRKRLAQICTMNVTWQIIIRSPLAVAKRTSSAVLPCGLRSCKPILKGCLTTSCWGGGDTVVRDETNVAVLPWSAGSSLVSGPMIGLLMAPPSKSNRR